MIVERQFWVRKVALGLLLIALIVVALTAVVLIKNEKPVGQEGVDWNYPATAVPSSMKDLFDPAK